MGLHSVVFPATSRPWARGCLACQRHKIHRHTRLVPIPIPQWGFSHLHFDLVGPLQYTNSLNYIFTIIDRTSKWMEAIPLSETSAAACAKVLSFTWISRFGMPETITSDRGPQFTSNLWFQLCEMLNISHKQTTAHHPESNSAVKRLHRHLKDALCVCRCGNMVRGVTLCAPWTQSTAKGRHWSFPVFPRLRQFSVLKLSCQMNFCKMMNFQLTPLSKIFPKPCLFLLFLCLGTILAPSCPASCQLSCSPPPPSGSVGVAWFHPFSHSTTAPTQFAPRPPLLHHQSRVAGRGGCCQQP